MSADPIISDSTVFQCPKPGRAKQKRCFFCLRFQTHLKNKVALTVGGAVVHAILKTLRTGKDGMHADNDVRFNHTHKSTRFPHGKLLKESVLVIVTPVTIGKCHQTQQVRMPSSLWGSGTCVHVRYGDRCHQAHHYLHFMFIVYVIHSHDKVFKVMSYHHNFSRLCWKLVLSAVAKCVWVLQNPCHLC